MVRAYEHPEGRPLSSDWSGNSFLMKKLFRGALN